MEEILSTKKHDRGSEKYNIRETFNNFFPDRGCIFFVRPVNEESLLQRIETLKKSKLRPEFLEALEEFKSRISQNLVPKTFGGKVLDGVGFLSMVEEILTSFNDKETPQLLGVIQRIRGEEIRKKKNEIEDWVNRFLHENMGKENLVEKGATELINMTIQQEGHKKNMEEELFSDGWKYFLEEKNNKAEYEQVVRTKLLAGVMSEIKKQNQELLPDEIINLILDNEKIKNNKFTINEAYESIFKRIINSQKSNDKQELLDLKEKMREKDLDLEHEKKKANMANEQAENWKKAIEAGEEEAKDLRVKLNNQKDEMKLLRGAQSGESDLILQLELITSQKTELEKENRRLKENGSDNGNGNGGRPANLEDLLGGLEGGEGGEEVRMMVQAMREELMAENENLREKIEEMGHQNQNLKMEITDITVSKEKEIEK